MHNNNDHVLAPISGQDELITFTSGDRQQPLYQKLHSTLQMNRLSFLKRYTFKFEN